MDFPDVPVYNGRIDRRRKDYKEWYANNMIQPKKSYMTDTTINIYILKIKIIQHLMGYPTISQDCITQLMKLFQNNKTVARRTILKEISWLKDIKATVLKLRQAYANNHSFKYFIAILASLCSRIKKFQNDHQMLSLLYRNIHNEYITQRGNNQEETVINYHDEDDKITKYNNIQDITDKLIFGLYMFMLPRRIKDIALLKLVHDNEDQDTRYNYMLMSDGNIKVIYNNYKTSNTYGTQTFDVPIILYDCIFEYIAHHQIVDGMFLFKQKKNDHHLSIPFMSNKIKQIMQNTYNVECSNRSIRRSAVSNLGNVSLNERKQIARAMGHSVNEQLLYAQL